MVSRIPLCDPAERRFAQNPATIMPVETETITTDRLDRRIMSALQFDGRASFRRIARALGSSEQTVARRYRRLREAGILRVVVLPDPRASRESLFVRIRTAPGAAAPIGKALAGRPDVSWVTLAAAGTEVLCSLRIDDPRDRDDLVLKNLPRLSQVTDVSTATMLHIFAGTGLQEWQGFDARLNAQEIAALGARSRRNVPVHEPGLTPDDDALLAPLAADGRISFAALAAATGRNESAVARRVEALLERGVLFVDVEVAHALIGFRAAATLWLTVAPADIHRVGSEIALHPEVGFVGAVSGPASLVVAVTCRDTADLYRYITERLAPITAIRQHEVTVTVRNLKQAGTVMDGDRLPRL
ncbi:DNA-binding Lrp family transcriptional regulator [Solirubrobacter pauli]|uniref:DNA-binding Lrp family transcriptional regulator n=1 Tax=Solirubrobacter pauli TaxID=166793 RepID=A0A660L5X1_9ACTN|nr:DNA-binding Lrp family transcriptional regulator [Solirubrobacter pauli]